LPWRSLQPGMAAAVLVSGALLFLAYAGYVQRERPAPPVVFSAESREAPETAAAPSAGPESPPPDEPAPTVHPALPPHAARRPQAAPPAAKIEGALADRDAVAPSEEEAVADAVAADAATADTAAAPEPPAERSRREARTAPAELKAAGEIGGAGAPAAAVAQAAPPANADPPVALGPGIEKPVKIAGEELEFARLREARWPPVVILEAVITRQGRMEDVRFVEPQDLDPRIAAELRRTLQTWRYRPATRDGQPVAVRMTITAHIHWR
ncbi:MAG TPA: energy transducer TonB, partial [Thermoanaerobaculia bacterium]|nr:energy transducer TonB [Thermoanaerobaculia bacterium]